MYFDPDRRLLMRMVRVFLYFSLSMLVVVLYMWGLQQVARWWVHVLWTVFVSVLLSSLILRKARLWKTSLLLPVSAAVVVGMLLVVGVTVLAVPARHELFIPAVAAVHAGIAAGAVSAGLQAYVHSLHHTQEHYLYLLANGASHLEAVMPSARRSIRAVLMPLLRQMTTPVAIAPPMLLCGLLMAGASPVAAGAITLLLAFIVLLACVLTMVLILLLADWFFFDRSGRFLL